MRNTVECNLMMLSYLLILACFGVVIADLDPGSDTLRRRLDDPKKGTYHQHMYNSQRGNGSSRGDNHKKTWAVLSEVDGLKNEEVAMFVTSTNNFEGAFLRERIIPSSRTWMRFFANVFVIVEDTFDVRFSMRNCEVVETTHYTTFVCHNEPTYVLSRKCTNEYYGAAGPCCKVDDAFNYLLNDRPEFAATIKYALHCDDDTFWRADQVLKWLALLDKSGVSSLPLIGNVDPHKESWPGVWHISGCQEIQTNGWYQPLMLNAAALKLIKNSVSNYGVSATCKGFDVTHDVGVGVYAWLFGLYHVQIPHLERNDQHKGVQIFNPEQMIIHYVKPAESDLCREQAKWPERQRYNQNSAIGCGDVDKPGPFHDKNKLAMMYDAWEYFREHGKDIPLTGDDWPEQQVTMHPAGTGKKDLPRIKHILTGSEKPDANGKFNGDPVEKRKIPMLKHLTGYETTPHSKKHDIVKSWADFSVKDCNPPGKVDK